MEKPNEFVRILVAICGLLLFSGQEVSAATSAFFPFDGGRVMINVQAPRGRTDGDAKNLYHTMNVEPKDSVLGPGKTIQFGNNILAQVCAIRDSGTTYTCSILIQRSPYTTLNPLQQYVALRLTGPEATALFEKLVPTEGTAYRFQSSDKKLTIFAQKNQYEMVYTGR
jgi:hypothetical protein